MTHIYTRYDVKLVRDSVGKYEVENIVNHPREIVAIANQVLGMEDKPEESFVVIALDNRKKVVGLFEVSKGTVNASLVHPREVFKRLMLVNAASFACLHNHPSGKPEPSGEDRELTRRLSDAGTLLGISLVDHVIIGHGSYYSFKENREMDRYTMA